MMSETRTAKHCVPVWDVQGYTLGYVTPQMTSVGVCRITKAPSASFGHLMMNPNGRNPWGWLTTVKSR